ncbi:MAG: hypothetical protein E6J19_15855 [Chloroflexi bacterium]|nr:MAG: hypothetical protein E6J19_15855 [Chloroflexota bacterium]
MDPHTRTTPAHSRHLRTRRLRTHPTAPKTDDTRPLTGGGGASGRGPIDDDDRGRRPDGDGDSARPLLLIALGILAMGASIMSARMLANARRRRGTFLS